MPNNFGIFTLHTKVAQFFDTGFITIVATRPMTLSGCRRTFRVFVFFIFFFIIRKKLFLPALLIIIEVNAISQSRSSYDPYV